MSRGNVGFLGFFIQGDGSVRGVELRGKLGWGYGITIVFRNSLIAKRIDATVNMMIDSFIIFLFLV